MQPCLYNRLAAAAARCQLRALPRMAFVGDSLLRNVFENLALLLDRPTIAQVGSVLFLSLYL
eukprot:SAG11_NODE_2382_length_3425_cov_2.571257_3_plen_62_part_00